MLHWVCVEHAGQKAVLELPHRLYYEFSVRAFIKVQDLRPILEAALKDESPRGKQKQVQLLYENRLAMNDVLVYGALSLEAYINYYAMRYDLPFHRDLERSLSTINKWKIYSNSKTRKTLDSETIKIIKRVFQLRDDIVHPKPERVLINNGSPAKGRSAQAKVESIDKGKLIIDINSVFKAVFKIDNDEKVEYEQHPWLYELTKVS